jgi:pimeloyl-ACP methyl ester carboxylesterase
MSNYPYPELPQYFVDALGISTGYYMMGVPNGRPVILLHGMSTSADSFRENMHELANDLWLIAPDIPGFGYSENTVPYTVHHLVEWLAAFKDVLELPPVAMIGHSFGGLLATAYAVAYPEDVTRILMAAPALLNAESYPEFIKKVGISLGLVDLGSKISQSAAWVKRQIKTPFFNADLQDESVWERRLKDYELARASAGVLKAAAFHHVRADLPQLHHPIHLVWGENDPVVPPSDAQVLLGLLPNAEVTLLPECGHILVLEKQAEFQQIARQFLR